MFEVWNNASLHVVDSLLGWLLRLPSDVAILGVALISALIITLIRRFTTNQDLLGRIAHDKKRLRELARSADKEAKQRYRGTRSLVMLKALKAEGWPLLFSLLPVGLLATWCIFRLEYRPPTAADKITVVVETPITKVGLPIHLVPQDGLNTDGWVRAVEECKEEGRGDFGQAKWTLLAKASPQPYSLLFRLDKRSYGHPLIVGQTHYATPVDVHSDEVVTYVEMEPVRLFGVVPGIPALAFPPWLVAYLLLTIPCAVLVKRLTGTW